MSSRKLRRRSNSVDSRAGSDHNNTMDEDSRTCFSQEGEITIRENRASESALLNPNLQSTGNENAISNENPDEQPSNISKNQLQDFLMTVMQTIQAESAKFTSAVESLRSEIKKENEILAKSLTAKFDAAQDKIREDFNMKLNSEILIVSERIENVRKDNENEISKLSSTIDKVNASVSERVNAHVTQTRKQVDIHGQEVLNASRAVLANINDHKEQTEVVINNIREEVTKTIEYVDDKFSIVSGDKQQIRRNTDEISKLNATLEELQNKLVAGNSNTPQSADSGNVIVRVTTADQQAVTESGVEANLLPSTNGVNVCSNSACHYSNSVVSQNVNSDICKHVNVTSEVQSRSVDLSELTLPSFTDSTKQVPLHFIRDLDLYFKLKQTPDHLKLPLTFRAVQEPVAKQWFSSTYDKLTTYDEFKKGFTELLWNPNRQAGIRSQIYLDTHSPNSGESYVDHYIRYANLASSLDPPLADMDLLSALTSHYEPKVQQGLLCGNFKCTQDVLGYLAKVQGLGEHRDSFKAPRREYASGDANRRPQVNSGRDDRPRDRGNNVNVHYVRGQTGRRNSNYSNRRHNNSDDREFYGRRQGRAEGNSSGRLNPTAQHFAPQTARTTINLERNDRNQNSEAQSLNN